jgi:hypothetical protein
MVAMASPTVASVVRRFMKQSRSQSAGTPDPTLSVVLDIRTALLVTPVR